MKIIRFLVLILALFVFSCERGGEKVAIQIKGSDTEVNLVQRLAEAFMKKHPEISIAVTGGGSGTGIAALINGKTDIANSSRPIRKEEIEQAKKRGINPVPIVFALDGLAIIVNKDLPINSVTLDQLADIFKGNISNWKELGGPDMPITPYGRQSNSGTYIFFRDNFLKGDYSPKVRRMNGNAQIVEAVKKDRSGIGYVGIGYVVEKGKVVEGIKVLSIVVKGVGPVSPLDREKVIKGIYPLRRPLYQYTNGKPKGNILKFLRFELSPEGQRIVSEEGYYPVTEEFQGINREAGVL